MLTTNPHPGNHLDATTDIIPETQENSIKSVPNAFSLLPTRTNYNAFHESDIWTANEYKEIQNHFQGIQRLRDGQHFVISGGSKIDNKANLVVCQANNYGLVPNTSSTLYGFKRLESAIGSNVIAAGKVPSQDAVVGIFQLNTGLEKYWHAGGMDLCGDILAVPLENSEEKKSLIRFYDFSDPAQPIRIKGQIEVNGNSGGVALTREEDGRFLCASWTDSDDGPDRFDFYISRNINDLSEWESRITYDYRIITPEDNMNPKFQAINFIRQDDGRLFLIGTENSNKLAPILGGRDRAYLYEIIKYVDGKGMIKYHLVKLNQKDFEGGGSFANFGAGAGVFVNSQNTMSMYAVYHWRGGGTIRIGEYWPVLEPNRPKISFKRDLVIELFEHQYFNGKILRIFDEKFSKLDDFNQILIEGQSFNDRTSSMRMLLPEGYKFILYKDIKQTGEAIAFRGNGSFQEFPAIGSINDHFSSCCVKKSDEPDG
jgi:hypothetical protein